MNFIPKDAIKKVAVIGAGASGLVAAKEALAAGFEVTVFEQSDNIGGIWNYKDHEAHSSVYKSTYINTTKEMMAFSDFPMPDSFPVFCHHTRVMEYFEAYAEHFNLREHIKFNTQVLSITPVEPLSENWTQDPQTWLVKYTPNTDNTPLYLKEKIDQDEAIAEEFDAVMVCTGHHTVPRWPKPAIEGMNTFKGPMIHSHSYKDVSNPLDLADKRVLVVGIGNSAVDIACEISRVTKQTYLSTRTGAWVVPKYLGGVPSGYKLPSRTLRNLPRRLIVAVSEMIIKKQQGPMAKWGLDPHCRLDQIHPTVSQDLLGRIGHGSIIVKPGIERMDENSVSFVDGSSQELDAIIFCTGYDIKFSFLDESILRVSTDNDVDIYKYVFLPAQSPTISMVGLVQQVGALMPISELQSRWICQVLQGNIGLPSQRKMLADIAAKKTAMRHRYLARARHTIQVDAVDYMDELAAQFGVMPRISRHPKVMGELLFGPILPVHYRLDGPGAWPDAEKCLKKLVADIKQKM